MNLQLVKKTNKLEQYSHFLEESLNRKTITVAEFEKILWGVAQTIYATKTEWYSKFEPYLTEEPHMTLLALV